MDVDHKSFVGIIQRPQKRRLLPVAAIGPNPPKAQSPGAGCAHHVQGMLGLRFQLPRTGRDARLIAALRIVDPLLRKVEPHVDRGLLLSIRQHGKDRHLAIVDLTQPATPLPRHPNRLVALLDE